MTKPFQRKFSLRELVAIAAIFFALGGAFGAVVGFDRGMAFTMRVLCVEVGLDRPPPAMLK